jgi:hypothetical protein
MPQNRHPNIACRRKEIYLRAQERLVPVRNRSNPEARDRGHSTQEGTVDDAPGEVADGDAVPLVVAVGVEVDDDPLAAVGAVNVTTGGGVEVEEVAAAIAGRLAAPDTAGVPTRGVAAIVERFTAPEPVVAVCTVAGPARVIRSGSATRYGWAISVSYPCVRNCYEMRRVAISPTDPRGSGGHQAGEPQSP